MKQVIPITMEPTLDTKTLTLDDLRKSLLETTKKTITEYENRLIALRKGGGSKGCAKCGGMLCVCKDPLKKEDSACGSANGKLDLDKGSTSGSGSESMEKVAPPGFDEATMHKLKGKYGETSAFKIAWAAHNKKAGSTKKSEDLDKAEKKIYASTYCNKGHYIHNGHPVNHECRILPPKALEAEMNGDYDTANDIMSKAPRKIMDTTKKSEDLTKKMPVDDQIARPTDDLQGEPTGKSKSSADLDRAGKGSGGQIATGETSFSHGSSATAGSVSGSGTVHKAEMGGTPMAKPPSGIKPGAIPAPKAPKVGAPGAMPGTPGMAKAEDLTKAQPPIGMPKKPVASGMPARNDTMPALPVTANMPNVGGMPKEQITANMPKPKSGMSKPKITSLKLKPPMGHV